MDRAVEKSAREIKTMKVRGAAEIGRHAALALASLAMRHRGTPREFERELNGAGRLLIKARPTAVSLSNAVTYVLRGLEADEPARDVARRAQDFTVRSLRARDDASTHAAAKLKGPVALTMCNSQAAVEALAKAKADGRIKSVIAFETRPWQQGLLTVKQLRAKKVPVTLAVDSAAASLALEADSCVVGADTLAGNGDVVNKIGTRMLALAASDAGIPFIVTAESFKAHPTLESGADVQIEERPKNEVIDPRKIPGVKVRNPVFDVTPADMVTKIATELGASRPDVAVRKARKAWA